MATPKKPALKKKSSPFFGSVLDDVGWVIGQIALPIPDAIQYRSKKKKKK